MAFAKIQLGPKGPLSKFMQADVSNIMDQLSLAYAASFMSFGILCKGSPRGMLRMPCAGSQW